MHSMLHKMLCEWALCQGILECRLIRDARHKNSCVIEIKRKATIPWSKMKGDFFPVLGILELKEKEHMRMRWAQGSQRKTWADFLATERSWNHECSMPGCKPHGHSFWWVEHAKETHQPCCRWSRGRWTFIRWTVWLNSQLAASQPMGKICIGDVCGTESCKDVIYVSLYNSFLFFTIETENRITEELCCYPGLFHKLSTLNKINMKMERQPQTVRNPKTRKSTESLLTQIFWKWICASLSLKTDYPWSPVFLGQSKKDLELGPKRKADVRMAIMVALSLHLKAIPNLQANNEEHKQHSQGIYYHAQAWQELRSYNWVLSARCFLGGDGWEA